MKDDPFHPANRLGTSAANASIWQKMEAGDRQAIETRVENGMTEILDALCIDTEKDPNSKDTAKRYARMMCNEICRGRLSPPPVITTFPNTKQLDELVATGPITVRSLCSHHFCPILGHAWVGVIYGERIAGLSKFSRIVDWFASRPQIQEELAVQIADFIEAELKPKGVAVIIEAVHTCMTWRGVKENNGSKMATNVMRGVFRDKPEARAEFLAFARR